MSYSKEAALKLANEALAKEKPMTPAPWEWWTSNSFRRLSAKGDGDVLHGTIQRHDNHPDVVCSEADQEGIVFSRNNLKAMATSLQDAVEEINRLNAQVADLRMAVIHVCDYVGSHIDERQQLRAIRSAANHSSEPFTDELVNRLMADE